MNNLARFLLLTVALVAAGGVFAQIGPPPPPGGGVPVDGGASLLVAAGIGYGAKKLRDARKRKQEGNDSEA